MKIRRGTVNDSEALSILGTQTFLESHGHSATKEEIEAFIQRTYTPEAFLKELENPQNIYHLIFDNEQVAGYSKIILNQRTSAQDQVRLTKLDRIYVLQKYFGQGYGEELFYNVLKFSQSADQKGMWLYTWIENKRAIRFYKKHGFDIIGSYDFKISETHVNPNHIMYLSY